MPTRPVKDAGISRDEMLIYLSRTDITPAQRRLAELRLEYSEISMIRNTQLRALEPDIIYPVILPIQVTGRWSYLKPNISGFSKKCINPTCPKGQHSKTKLCWSVQECIRPYKGTFWITHDLDAVEHRIYCLILQWEERLAQLRAGEDIHTPVACEIFNLSYPLNKLDPHSALEDEQWRLDVKWQGKNDARRTLGKNMTYGGQYFYVRFARHNEKVRAPYRIYQGLWYNPSFVYTIPNIQTFKFQNEVGDLVVPNFEELAIRFVESTIDIQKRKAILQEKCRVDKEARTLYGGLRREYFSNQDTAKQLFNYMVQGTVASYIDETAVAIEKVFPDSYCVHNHHDSLKYAFPYTGNDHELEEQQVLEEVKKLAQRSLIVGEHEIPITATFSIVRREE